MVDLSELIPLPYSKAKTNLLNFYCILCWLNICGMIASLMAAMGFFILIEGSVVKFIMLKFADFLMYPIVVLLVTVGSLLVLFSFSSTNSQLSSQNCIEPHTVKHFTYPYTFYYEEYCISKVA